MGDETEFLAWDLVRTARLVDRRLAAAFEQLALSATEFGVLVQLEHHGRCSQVELARQVLVRPQTMNTVITAMVERGLVTRDGPAGSGRRTPIVITEPGRAALMRARPPVDVANRPDQLHLDQADGRELSRLLTLIRAGLEEE